VYGLIVRAVVVHEAGGPEVLRLEEMPDPQPAEGEVLVRVEAVGINHIDLVNRAGAAGSYPTVLGYDAAGRREDTGERVLVTVRRERTPSSSRRSRKTSSRFRTRST
jgi:NADPH:quinone reductase-like Zn-dependent oxidoreductase